MSTIASMVLNTYNGTPGPDTLTQNIADYEAAEKALKEVEQQQRKEQIQNALKKGIWSINFTKVDGTPATMDCTLDGNFLPGTNADEQSSRKQSPDLVHVFSTDRNGWRSFKVDQLNGMVPFNNPAL